MRKRAWSWALVALAWVVFGSGCGNRLVRVKGIATMDGKPLEYASVTFMPTDGKGQPATGMTEANGSFSVSTMPGNPNGEGAWPGTYKVVVERIEYPAPGMAGGPTLPDGLTDENELLKWISK